MTPEKKKELVKKLEQKGFLQELGVNKYYRDWCAILTEKPPFREWIIDMFEKYFAGLEK